MKPVNLAEKLSTFTEYWQPRTVGAFNGHDLMVVKVNGAFVWHKHDATDDFFLVLKGRVTIQMRDGNVTLGPGSPRFSRMDLEMSNLRVRISMSIAHWRAMEGLNGGGAQIRERTSVALACQEVSAPTEVRIRSSCRR